MFFFIFGLLPLVIGSYYAITTIYSTITSLTQAQFHEISQAISADTLSLFSKKQEQLRLTADSGFFKRQMTKDAYVGAFLNNYLTDTLKINPELDEIICLANHSGSLKYLESTNQHRLKLKVPTNIQKEYNENILFAKNKVPTISKSKLDNEEIFSIFEPAYDSERKQHVLQGVIKLKTIQNNFRNIRIGGLSQSKNQFILILDTNDKLIYSPNFFDQNSNLSSITLLKANTDKKAVYLDFFEKKYLAYQYIINKFGWKIIILKNSELTLKALDELSDKTLFLTVLLLISISIVSLFISRSFFAPLIRLKDVAYNYSNGNFDVKYISTGQDEISQLAQSMKIMGDKLQSYTRDLEKTVDERTKELRDSLVEVENAKAEADRSNKIKSDFLGVVSHELRTPLNGITGSAELINDLTSDDEEITELTDILKTSAIDLTTLVNGLLEYIQLEKNRVTLNIKEFHLENELEEVIESLLPKANKLNTNVVLDYDFGVPSTVIGDPERLRIIMQNLIDNAIKFNPGGNVYIHVISNDLGDNRVTLDFYVTDTGIGICKDQIDSILTLFYQVDGTHTRRHGGTGLGLSLVTSLLNLMNSKLKISSTPNQSTTFSFQISLPYCENYLPSPKEADKVDTVAIFSDDTKICKILINKFSDHSIQAYTINPSINENGLLDLSNMENYNQPFCFLIDETCTQNHKNILSKLNHIAKLHAIPKVLMSSNINAEKGLLDPDYSHAIYKPIYSSKIKQLSDTILHGIQHNSKSHLDLYIDKKFLLVEDNPTNQIYARIFLQKLGAQVTIANHGQEAIDILEREQFDLILMDCLMPVMDGFEACKIIRANNIFNRNNIHIPIIALTALATKSDLDHCLDSGMNEIILKPINRKKAIEVIQKYL